MKGIVILLKLLQLTFIFIQIVQDEEEKKVQELKVSAQKVLLP
jgi:hypothetical protein